MALGIFGGAAIKSAYDDYDMKNYSARYDDKGNLHYIDRKCQSYINHEKVVWSGYTDSNGIYHNTQVGVKSGKVYTDNISESNRMKMEMYEREKKQCIDGGYLAYLEYSPKFRCRVTTEISTGKTIAAVVWFHNFYTKEDHWVKFYTKPDAKEWQYDVVDKHDKGIEITEEEAKKYNFSGHTHTNWIGSENEYWGGFDMRKPEGWDEAYKKKLVKKR